MRTLILHFSAFVGILVFLNQLWVSDEIEQTVLNAFTVGLVLYVFLLGTYVVVHRIMQTNDQKAAAEEEGLHDEDNHLKTTQTTPA